MSTPRFSATIEFPASKIDSEIRELLEEEGVRFKPQIFGTSLELDSPQYDLDTEINKHGIFRLHNPEARYGEFEDLELAFVTKGIPFDRESGMDWNSPPAIRIFRPGPPVFDQTDSTPDGYEEVVSVSKIRELLATDDAGEEAASNIRRYLDEAFPSYPPLIDFVKGAQDA
ncbi:MAG: hypothetical protein ACLQED_13890 [Desulfobaccales bacterium]|jgi:hypothetical protein